ncbi:MAG: hypothetical protein Cons2KO_11060 [Congregibacter sp.]
MLTVNKLEKIMELEASLREEYQGKIDAAEAALEKANQEHSKKIEDLQQTIKRQLATISELSEKAGVNEQMEQRNRELSNRSERQLEEITTLKRRTKSLQKDLASERAELAELKQFDPARMKKNLDANKKKLAENKKATDLLNASLKKARTEKAELEAKLKQTEEELNKLKEAQQSDDSNDQAPVEEASSDEVVAQEDKAA